MPGCVVWADVGGTENHAPPIRMRRTWALGLVLAVALTGVYLASPAAASHLGPHITDVDVQDADLTTIDVSFDMAVCTNDDGTGDLVPSDFVFTDASGGGVTITSVSFFEFDSTGQITLSGQGATATDTLAAASGQIFDCNPGPAAGTEAVGVVIWDNDASPIITDAATNDAFAWAINTTRTQIRVPFDVPVYTNVNGTGGLVASDFVLTSAASITSVSHSAGATSAVLTLSAPFDAAGNDLITVAANQVYSSVGEAMDPNNIGDFSVLVGPFLVGAELAVDGDGDGNWNAVNDVLRLTWSVAASARGSLTTEADFEAMLGLPASDLTLGGGGVAITGGGTTTWYLRVTGSTLADGVAVGDAVPGTNENANVVDGSNARQIATSGLTVQPGTWVGCGTVVGPVTVNSRCIQANGFQTSTDGTTWTTVNPTDGNLDLDVFDQGLLQVQVVDDSRLGGSPDQYELVSGAGAKLAATTRVRIHLNLGSMDPAVLIGTGDLVSYGTTSGADNTVEIVALPSDASWLTTSACNIADAGGCGNDSTAASVDYSGMLTFAMDDLSDLGDADFVNALRGAWIMTDAQAFAVPSWDEAAQSITVDLAAPHLLTDGTTVNTGQFKAFIPDAMFGTAFFNVSKGTAIFSASAGGSAAGISVTSVTGGVEIEVTGFSYSAPEIAIKAATPPTSGGGGGTTTPPTSDGGGGTTTVGDTTSRTVAPGGSLSTAADATSDKPTKASVTSPVAGTVEITPKQSTTTALASGQTLLNVEVEITAPAATPQGPLALGFELDASLLTGVDPDRLVVYRNGQPVRACAHPSAAVPDPCLAGLEVEADGDLALSVRTSQASTWNFATVDTACPSGIVPIGSFDDFTAATDGAAAIDCVGWWDLANGRVDGSFAPSARATRGQMATLLANLLSAVGVELPAAPPDWFGDDDSDTHETAINQLAALGLVFGVDGRSYLPHAPIARDAVASLIMRVYEHIAGTSLRPGTDAFADDNGNVHEAAINKGVASGLIDADDGYDPSGRLTRGEAAGFLVAILERLVADGLADPPLN